MAELQLFIISFLSSTLLPGGSEAYLLYLLSLQQYDSMILLILASIGNSLGGMTNYVIGLLIINKFIKPQYNLHQQNNYYLKSTQWIKKYGTAALLLSWLPLIGDLLCLVAGLVKLNWLKVLIFIYIGKFLRYAFVIGIY